MALRLAPLPIPIVAAGAWFAFDTGFHSRSGTRAASTRARANEFDTMAQPLVHEEVRRFRALEYRVMLQKSYECSLVEFSNWER